MDLFGKVDFAKVRERMQASALEDPWPPGRKKLTVLIAPQKDEKGENVGVVIKCETIRGKSAPVAFLDYDTATRWMYAARFEYSPKSVCLGTIERKEWRFPVDQKVLVITPAHVQGVRPDPAWKTTLSDELLRKLGEIQ